MPLALNMGGIERKRELQTQNLSAGWIVPTKRDTINKWNDSKVYAFIRRVFSSAYSMHAPNPEKQKQKLKTQNQDNEQSTCELAAHEFIFHIGDTESLVILWIPFQNIQPRSIHRSGVNGLSHNLYRARTHSKKSTSFFSLSQYSDKPHRSRAQRMHRFRIFFFFSSRTIFLFSQLKSHRNGKCRKIATADA